MWFNTTCLIGPNGILTKYRKVHPWIPWEVHTSPHDLLGNVSAYDEPLYPVAETEIGRIGAAICYDWLFPEAIRQLALNGAEILIRVSAYMDPWGTAAPLDWWTLINRTRAIENLAYVVAANQGAKYENYPPFSWPGGSMIVDFDGRILAQAEAGPGERIVVGPIDIGVCGKPSAPVTPRSSDAGPSTHRNLYRLSPPGRSIRRRPAKGSSRQRYRRHGGGDPRATEKRGDKS